MTDACCGHGGRGYVALEGGTVLYFDRLEFIGGKLPPVPTTHRWANQYGRGETTFDQGRVYPPEAAHLWVTP